MLKSRYCMMAKGFAVAFALAIIGNMSVSVPAQACLVEEGGDQYACTAFYCAMDRGYWSDGQKRCYRAGFIGTHRQTRSNAGDCANCTVNIFHTVQSDTFALVASNGWVAILRYADDTRTTASGEGTWPQQFGAYSGRKFSISLSRRSDKKSMDMRIDTPGVGRIAAAFAMGPMLPAFAAGVPQ